MTQSVTELPSNRKFGLFFAVIFWGIGAYLYHKGIIPGAYTAVSVGFLFFIIGILEPDLLLPLNRLWMRLGLFLGMIVSPIVLGLIFFLVFTPVSLIMRLTGRDELRLRFREKANHWIHRDPASESGSFKNQF